MHEREITKTVDLCTPTGRLNREAVGWSRRPLHNCNLHRRFPRKKRWNYWCITTKDFLFSATLSDIDYLGLAFVYFLDFETGYFHEFTLSTLLGKGIDLPDTVAGSVEFNHQNMKLAFDQTTTGVKIRGTIPDFDGKVLRAWLDVCCSPEHETLNVVVPWNEKQFQFTSKQNTLPTTGFIQLGERVYTIQDGFACLDLGRGIWPYSSYWNWAAASGVSQGHTIGLNFGAGWTDGTGATENGVCIDGKLTKISSDVQFQYQQENLMLPWTLRSETYGVDITFVPFFHRTATTNAKILCSHVDQMIGHFSGIVTDVQGKEYKFKDIVGWAEEHFARW